MFSEAGECEDFWGRPMPANQGHQSHGKYMENLHFVNVTAIR
jgi:hypothetical protein